jgi:hypothetical protein
MDILETIYAPIIRRNMNHTPFSPLMAIKSKTDLKPNTDSTSESLSFNYKEKIENIH